METHKSQQTFDCTSSEMKVECVKEIKAEEALLKSLEIALFWIDQGRKT